MAQNTLDQFGRRILSNSNMLRNNTSWSCFYGYDQAFKEQLN